MFIVVCSSIFRFIVFLITSILTTLPFACINTKVNEDKQEMFIEKEKNQIYGQRKYTSHINKENNVKWYD